MYFVSGPILFSSVTASLILVYSNEHSSGKMPSLILRVSILFSSFELTSVVESDLETLSKAPHEVLKQLLIQVEP